MLSSLVQFICHLRVCNAYKMDLSWVYTYGLFVHTIQGYFLGNWVELVQVLRQYLGTVVFDDVAPQVQIGQS